MTSWAAGTPPASSGASTGTVRLTSAEPDRAELVVPGGRTGEADRDVLSVDRGLDRIAVLRAAGRRCRPGSGRPAGAAGGRGCAPGPPSPGPGSSPCSGARRSRSSRPRAGSSGGRCPGRAGARARRSAAPRTPTSPPPRPPAAPGHRPLGQQVPLHHEVDSAERPRFKPGRHPLEPRDEVARAGTEHGEHRVVRADVGHLDPHHEPHGLEELHQRRRGARLGVQPRRGAVVGQRQVVFHVPVRAEDEGLGGGPRRPAPSGAAW